MNELERLIERFERWTGLDLDRGSSHSALERYLRLHLPPDDPSALSRYVDDLTTPHHPEALRLVDAITVCHTSFYRDPEQLAGITEVLRLEPTRVANVWIPACATGEDPYSIALIAESLGRPVSILGTDINTRALAHAKAGVYGPWSVRDLPPSMTLPRRADGSYEIPARLRQVVSFTRHNLMDVTPSARGGWDVILCRNVLMYISRPRVIEVIQRLAASLRPGGYLFVGANDIFERAPASLRFVRLGSRHALWRPPESVPGGPVTAPPAGTLVTTPGLTLASSTSPPPLGAPGVATGAGLPPPGSSSASGSLPALGAPLSSSASGSLPALGATQGAPPAAPGSPAASGSMPARRPGSTTGPVLARRPGTTTGPVSARRAGATTGPVPARRPGTTTGPVSTQRPMSGTGSLPALGARPARSSTIPPSASASASGGAAGAGAAAGAAAGAGAAALGAAASSSERALIKPSPSRAHALLLDGNTSAALDLVLEILEVDPLCVEARLIAGIAYQLSGDAQQATAALRAALVLAPDLWPAEMYLGFALLQLGEEANARRALRRGAQLASSAERLPLSPGVSIWFENWRVEAIELGNQGSGRSGPRRG